MRHGLSLTLSGYNNSRTIFLPAWFFNKIPSQATYVQTPLTLTAWRHHLQHHPHQDLVEYFLQVIFTSFRVGFNESSTHPAKNNLQVQWTILRWLMSTYLHNELSLGRTSGPCSPSNCPEVHINKFGVIPKNHLQNKW